MNRKTIERLLASESKHEFGEQGDTAQAVYTLEKEKCSTCGNDTFMGRCPSCMEKALPPEAPKTPDFNAGDLVTSLVDRPKLDIHAGDVGRICWAEADADKGGFTYCVDFGERKVLKIWTAPGLHVKDYALKKYRKGFVFVNKNEPVTITTPTQSVTVTMPTAGQLGLF